MKKLLCILMILCLCLSLAACSGGGKGGAAAPTAAPGGSSQPSGGGTPATQAPSGGGSVPTEAPAAPVKDEVIAAITTEITSGYDPIKGYGLRYDPILQSRLVKTWNGIITDDLATDYSVSDDGTVWRFTIRDNAYFSNGEKVKASDATFTFNQTKNGGGNLDLTNMVSAEAEDERTVKFTLAEPDYSFIYQISKLGIVPEAGYGDDYSENPIGSGPYKMVRWDKGQQAIWEYNEYYYGPEPAIKRIWNVLLDQVKKRSLGLLVISHNMALADKLCTRIVNLEELNLKYQDG